MNGPRLFLIIAAITLASLPVSAAPGDLDSTFGSSGQLVTAFGSGDAGAYDVALQSDGKVVAVGYSHNGTNKDFAVARYNADGTLDTTFNATGIATTDFGGSNDVASGVAVQSDGKIVVVGTASTASSWIFALARYQTDGTLDTSFGVAGTGRITTTIGNPNSSSNAVGTIIQPDGKILVAGSAVVGASLDVVVLRYNSDGNLDNDFGAGGLVSTNVFGYANHTDTAFDLASRSDGKILLGGHSTGPLRDGYLVTVYNSDGSPDAGFATGGIKYGEEMNRVHCVAWQADGKILIGGISGSGAGRNFSLRRFSQTGVADTTFGTNGSVITPIGTAADAPYDMAVQGDGKIVVVGLSYNADTGFEDFAVVRYNEDGSLDTSFRGTGKVTTNFPGGNSIARSVDIGPAGRIVLAGQAHDGSKNDFALARYVAEGSLITTTPAHHSQINNSTPMVAGKATPGFTVAVHVDGGVAGTTVADGNGDWNFILSSSLTDGLHTAAATETDGLGSTSPLSNIVIFTVDTVPPEPPVITSPAEDELIVSSWPVISGTAEAGTTVKIYLDDTLAGQVIAGSNGQWSYTPSTALANGLRTVKASATDRAGNLGIFSSSITFTSLAALFGGPGNPDPTFGTGGQVVTAMGAGSAGAYGVALQSDGKVVAVGYTHNGSNNDFAVVRYNADGSLDTTFNGTGIAITDFGSSNDSASGVVVQNDGKIIVAGTASTGSSWLFALARFQPDGSLDASFGVAGTGRVTTVVGNSSAQTKAEGVKIQPDGKILVVGHVQPLGNQDFAVLRYNGDGTLDNSFGAGGLVTSTLVTNTDHQDYAYDLALRSDGKILVAGHSSGSLHQGSMVTVYNSYGSPDSGFGTSGKLFLNVQSSGMTQVHCVAWQADGKILIGGINGSGSGRNFCMGRLNETGVADTTFGTSGLVITPIGTAADVPYDLIVQSDGKIVAVGSAYNANTGFDDFAVVRYNEDGSLDPTFRGTGRVTASFPGGSAVGRSVAIGPDGRMVIAGYANDGTKNNFALARFFGTDQPPRATTGDATGIVRSGAVLNGIVNPNNLATTAHFEYGLTPAYGSSTPELAMGYGYLDVPATSVIAGLTDNTQYHYRLVATNAAGTTYGENRSFTTAPNPPLAFTGEAANVSASSATLVGTVLPNGRDTTAYFEFGLSTAYGSQTVSQLVPATGTVENVFAPLTGLVAGATYHFRLVAINAGSPIPITGSNKTFVAQAPAPVVTLGAATPLTTTSVSLSGTVNANDASTQVFFDYGTDGSTFPNSVTGAPAIVAGTSAVPVTGAFTSLSQGITYHYRLRAVSAGGTTTSAVATFSLDLLSGLSQSFPPAPPDAQGFVLVNLNPPGLLHGWRFVGEQQWRNSGVPASGLTSGTREIEFRPLPGRIQPPNEVVSIISGGAATILAHDYYDAAGSGSGGLTVTIKPDSITTGASRAQWRLLGEDDASWRDSGVTISDLIAGSYLVECKPVSGHTVPPNANAIITAGTSSALTITYFVAEPQTGTPPSELAFSAISSDTTKPYAHVGQLRSSVGSSTGFVVKPRVVATAAHVVWDDGTLSVAQGLQWLFQRHRGIHEPKPVVPRGFYLFDGYAAQRALDNSPGDSSPESQTLDVAAIYFNEDAGRGGYGGFLASDLAQNEFLLSNANKMLVGYPVDGIATTSQGRMHATSPLNVSFTAAFGRTFTTPDIRSFGGNSGGPLCVQFEGGAYYPAAIYLGGTNQTVVRAIDSDVVDLFNRAEVSGNGGGNNTGGGITHTSVTTYGTASNPGALKILIEPAAAVSGGGGWRLAPETSYRASGAQKAGLNPGTYVLQLTTVAGYPAPDPQNVTVTGGQLTTLTYTYGAAPTPQEAWRQTYFGTTFNAGDAADDNDYDRDGFTNAEEFAAGTDPTQAGDYFKMDGMTHSGATFTATTSGKAGRTYVLQRSTTLAPGSWSAVDNAGPLGSDGPVSLTDAAPPNDGAFYRIQVTGP